MGMKTKFKHKVEQITEDQLAALNSAYRIATTEDMKKDEFLNDSKKALEDEEK